MSKLSFSRRKMLRLGAASAAAVALPRAVQAQDKKILRLRAAKDMAVLDPANVRTGDENDILTAISNKLVVFKPGERWDWQYDAATSLEQIDPTHVRFQLRPGILWTNDFGEMTAEDVKYSFERVADPAMQASNGEDWKPLDHIEIVDKYTGIMVLKSPFPALWGTTLPRPAGTIVCKKAVEQLPEKRFTTEPPATSGPYVIKEWVPKQKLVLARNPLWAGRQPAFDEIHTFPIDDQKAAELAFEADEVDYTEVSVSSVKRYMETPLPGTKLMVEPLVGIEWLGMNTQHPPLDDVRVRQAIRRAIDVQAVIDAAYFGVAKPATGLVPPGMLGHREKLMVSGRDLDESRRLLSESGHANGFKTTLSVLNNSDAVNAAQVVQANLAEVGIEVEVVPYESGTFWNLGVEAEGEDWKKLQLFMHKWGLPPDPGAMTQWFTHDQIGVWNWERWDDPEFNTLHQAGLVELDPAKRNDIYLKAQDRMEESGAYVWFTNGVQAVIYRDFIQPATTPDGRRLILPLFRYVG